MTSALCLNLICEKVIFVTLSSYFGNEQWAPVGALPEPAAIKGGSSRWLISVDLAKSQAMKVTSISQKTRLKRACLF
jgi:hypothetical protein